MKTTLKRIKAFHATLEEKVELRDSELLHRSVKWQENEKGEVYKEDTEVLRGILNNLSDGIYNLEERVWKNTEY